ncbi:MAG TPA: hypothetical protein VGZ73_26945 [Bryobacteraceae bacterium]|nr:hypothetical protein [Bryobacteraceae bacterium]
MRLITALLLASAAAQAEMPVRYVLAGRVLLADPAPDPRFDAQSIAGGEFRSRFEATFSGQVIELGPDRMISPDERVIVILPRITAVRTAHMVQAGSVHSFDTIIVGDVSALDPWTGSNLYSATRMVSGKVQLGQSAISDADAKIREGFQDAYSHWIAVSLEELRQKLAPFVLDVATVAGPEQARKSPGGIWPYGSERGVRQGAALAGTDGHFAHVTYVAGRFSAIEDVADPKRQIAQGERYTLTVVQKPTQRPEPRVALSWVGPPLTTPEESQTQVLNPEALLGLFSDYISKSGGLSLLPLDFGGAAIREEVRKLRQQVARYSKLASNGAMTLHAETLAQAAREVPEYRVEVGVIERYHGQRAGANNSVEHYYRVTLGAAVYGRYGSEESAQYPFQRVIQHSEELAQVTREGVREIDPADAWFTVTRNSVIRLSEKLVKELTQAPATESAWRQGHVQADHIIAWDGGPPPAGAPVEWLRPSGQVRTSSGDLLGSFERLMVPSQGFLNAQSLHAEKLELGDTLRYHATAVLPLVGLALEAAAPAQSWMIEPGWQLRLAGDTLSRALDIRIVPFEQSANGRVERILILNVSGLKADTRQDGALFSGQWRLRLVDAAAGTSGNPSFKTGVQTDTRADHESTAPALSPPDLSGWTLRYVADSLKKLADMAGTKGARAAVIAASPEGTHD